MIRPSAGALAPLSEPLFRKLWLGATAAHTGYWAQSVAVAWWLVEQGYGPQIIALAHVGSSLPVLLFSYLSGWLIDHVGYLRIQRLSQGWIAMVSTALVILTCMESPSPHVLLLLTGLMGAGVALRNPAWQAGVGQIVRLPHLSAAIVLSSVSFNLARATGPLLAGLLITMSGVAAALLYNAIVSLGFFVILLRLDAPAAKPHGGNALLAPVDRVARRWLRRVCIRAMGIGMPTSVLLALLPAIATGSHRSAAAYAWLLGAFGAGGLAAAMIRPRLIDRVGPDRLLDICVATFAACLLLVAWLPAASLAVPVALAGASWLMLFSTLNVAVHTHSPTAYRGRALAAYMTSAFGGMAVGGLLWGWLAQTRGCDTALQMAAIFLICFLALYRPRVCRGVE
jgi:MFS family permease